MIELDPVSRKNGCSAREALFLAKKADETELFRSATDIRRRHFGDDVQLCMILNAKSGECSMDCAFCSQSGHNSAPVSSYPLLESGVLTRRIAAVSGNTVQHCGIVTSGGRLTGDEVTEICAAVTAAAASSPLRICGSFGRLGGNDLERLKQAGLSRYHHNLETSEEYYPAVCTTQTWEQRRKTVQMAMEAGLDVCCGGLFGLGERWEDRIGFAMTLREMGIRSIPVNFLHPHEGTPLAGQPPLQADEALRIIAVYRHLLPDATLRVCGGRPTVLKERQRDIFAAGANAMMTGDYLTTSGQVPDHDLEMIRALGLSIAT